MKIQHIIAYITIALTLILLLVFGYWAFYPYKTFEYVGSKSLVLNKNKTVEAGEYVTVETNINHYTEGLLGLVSPQLIDGTVINYPDVTYITRKGHQKFERNFEIPQYVDPGIYHIEIQTSLRVNPIRTITYVRQSEDFLVTNCIMHCK